MSTSWVRYALVPEHPTRVNAVSDRMINFACGRNTLWNLTPKISHFYALQESTQANPSIK
jgi:hypothetical protein